MSSDAAIMITGVSKCFHIYDHPRDRLKQFLLPNIQRISRIKQKNYFREFWALRDVTFDVQKGETVGIIGRNGSGKSTLLQLICGTLNPTSGSITSNGRIAALLELGSGFNPEFTGLENAYLNAILLGLNHDEVDKRLDNILAFADIGDFIHQPVKTYSSGMAMRLAFAVAINIDPQILVVDEALSVGDELFQRKCFSRISQIKEDGATILLVSHSGSTVVEICDRAILLDAGELLCIGSPKAIVGKYQKLIYAPEKERLQTRVEICLSTKYSDLDLNDASDSAARQKTERNELEEFYDPNLISQSILSYASQGAFIEAAQILNQTGNQVNCLKRGETYCYRYMVRFSSGAANVRFGMLIKSTTGLSLGGAETKPMAGANAYIPPNTLVNVEFKFKCQMNPGTYFMNAGVLGTSGEADTYLHRVLDILLFKVLPLQNDIATAFINFECTPELTITNTAEQETLAQ